MNKYGVYKVDKEHDEVEQLEVINANSIKEARVIATQRHIDIVTSLKYSLLVSKTLVY